MRSLTAFLLPLAALAVNNYDPFYYDQGSTQFTPDGRILQVEYASKAASKSEAPIWITQLDGVTLVATTQASDAVVDRVLPMDNCLLVTSGLLPDATSLIRQHLFEAQDDRQRLMGTGLSPSLTASILAEACQQKSFGGGIRCCGASVLVIGTRGEIFVSNPSGSLQEYSIPTADGSVLSLRGSDAKDDDMTVVPSMKAFVSTAQRTLATKDRTLTAFLISPKYGIRKLTKDEIQRLAR